MSTYKVKHTCNVCHDGLTVCMHNEKYNYYYCKACNIMYVLEKQTDKYVRAYEPRKTIKL